MIFEDCEKNNEMGIKGKQMYYKKTYLMVILWFKVRIKLYFVENCKVFFVLCQLFALVLWPGASKSFLTTKWLAFGYFSHVKHLVCTFSEYWHFHGNYVRSSASYGS